MVFQNDNIEPMTIHAMQMATQTLPMNFLSFLKSRFASMPANTAPRNQIKVDTTFMAYLLYVYFVPSSKVTVTK